MEKSRQDVLDFKCEMIVSEVDKSSSLSTAPAQRPGIVGNQNIETKIVSLTPEKTNESLQTKYKDRSIKLPEKYKTLTEFFNRMNCSLRLLSLCKKLPTFQNISAQMEILTKRKVSYRHLAQIKYILPEALQIDKILIHDEKSLCMMADMKITLLFDVIEGHHEKSAFMALQHVFASRVLNFFNMHPEDCDIPEAILPVPFNQRNQPIILEALPVDSLMESQQTSIGMELLSDSSHLLSSISRHFCQRAVVAKTEKTRLLASPVPFPSARSDCVTSQNIKSGQQKDSPELCSKSAVIKPLDHFPSARSDCVTSQTIKSGQQKDSPELCSKSAVIKPLDQLIYPQCSVSPATCESPFVKRADVVDSLMVETPAQSTPKRSMPSCDDNLKAGSIKKLTSCPMPAKRSLDFSHLEGDESGLNFSTEKIECRKVVHDIMPQTVLTKGNFLEENFTCAPALLQKVEESNATSPDHEMSQTGSVMCMQMSACLPDLVALIHRIFKSVNCSLITKEELVHKIIMDIYDVVDKREVEEQIELLEKLVPDWICRKLTPSGDLLYKISQVSDLDSVRARLFNV